MTAKKRSYRRPVSFTQIALFVTPKQKAAIKRLSLATRISQQAHLREAVDDLLAKYRKVLK